MQKIFFYDVGMMIEKKTIKGVPMENEIYISLLGMALIFPLAISGAAAPVSNKVTIETENKRQFIVPEKVAELSKTIKHMVKDLPSEKKYFLPKMANKKFARVLPLMYLADSLLHAPFKERLQTISNKITSKLAHSAIEGWQTLIGDIDYFDIEILKQPLADSMIKYIYKQENGDQEKIIEKISGLPIPAEFKGLLAGYWYLNYGADGNYILTTLLIELNYGFSIEELATFNKLPDISGEGKLNLMRLDIIDLTGLTNIPNIASVKKLVLTDNRLKTLPNGIFKGLNNLIILDLWKNNLTVLNEDSFDGLNNLRELYLSSNKLTTLPENLIRAFAQSKLEKLTISLNPLDPKTIKLLKGQLGDRVRFD